MQQVFFEDSFFVHLFYEWPDFLFGELPYVVAEQNLVLGQRGQWSGSLVLQNGFGHATTFNGEMSRSIYVSIPRAQGGQITVVARRGCRPSQVACILVLSSVMPDYSI